MGDIRFECTHCGQHLQSAPDMAGSSLQCPVCDRRITIPNPAIAGGGEPIGAFPEVHEAVPEVPEPPTPAMDGRRTIANRISEEGKASAPQAKRVSQLAALTAQIEKL